MKKKKKLSKTAQRQIRCPHCGAIAVLRPASEIYHDPERTDRLYVCSNYPRCESYVSTYPGTNVPMGTLANGDLRNLRIKAHRKFDAVWKSRIMSRENAYRWISEMFSIPLRDAHIAMFGEYRCRELIRECDRVLANARRNEGGKHNGNERVSESPC